MQEGARPSPDPFLDWLAALEKRHLADLTLPELRRALQALSSLYVERRERLASGAALDSAGKRAAFALYYGALHFLVVREVVRALGAAEPPPARILDLGCGTGSAGAAWALETGGRSPVEGVDRSGWAAAEARWTLRALGLRGRAQTGGLEGARPGGPGAAVVAAFCVNELEDAPRERLRGRLMESGRRGTRVLVVEPLARRVAPWWESWAAEVRTSGGRDDEWRFPVELPAVLAQLDRAAGLDHRELTARSLWLDAGRNA